MDGWVFNGWQVASIFDEIKQSQKNGILYLFFLERRYCSTTIVSNIRPSISQWLFVTKNKKNEQVKNTIFKTESRAHNLTSGFQKTSRILR